MAPNFCPWSALLDVPPVDDTVRRWIKAGVLPAYRFPPGPTGEVRIAKADAIAFIERARFRA